MGRLLEASSAVGLVPRPQPYGSPPRFGLLLGCGPFSVSAKGQSKSKATTTVLAFGFRISDLVGMRFMHSYNPGMVELQSRHAEAGATIGTGMLAGFWFGTDGVVVSSFSYLSPTPYPPSEVLFLPPTQLASLVYLGGITIVTPPTGRYCHDLASAYHSWAPSRWTGQTRRLRGSRRAGGGSRLVCVGTVGCCARGARRMTRGQW